MTAASVNCWRISSTTRGARSKRRCRKECWRLPRDQLKGRRIVAVAGGKVKVRAIKAVLESRYLSGLITDECTARALVDERLDDAAGATKRRVNGGSSNA